MPLYRYRTLGSCADSGGGRGVDVAILGVRTVVTDLRRPARHGRRAVRCPLRTVYGRRVHGGAAP